MTFEIRNPAAPNEIVASYEERLDNIKNKSSLDQRKEQSSHKNFYKA